MREVIGEFRQRRLAEPAGAAPSLEQRRASFSPGPSIYPIPPDVTVTPEAAAGVPCYWLTPEGVSAERVMLFLHGGGWMLGSLRSHGELAARLARASGMRVLFPEYRLAPEHPFPAAVDDVHTVWNWLCGVYRGGPASIALVGDSAGGGLALALLTALGAAGEARPGAAALMSPATDLTGCGASMTERVDDDPVFTPDTVRFLESTYLAGADPKLPLASPLFGDLAGLPPTLVQVGSAEVLFSDSQRLADAGANVTLHVGEGLPHVYQGMAETPEAIQATDQIGAFLRAHVA